MRTTYQILTSLNGGGDGRLSLPERLCHDCTADLGLTGAAMSLTTDEGFQAVVGSSSPLVKRLEELQFESGEGPAVEASRENRPVVHPDLTVGAATRWPVLAPAVLDAGIRCVYALPLQVGAVRLGGLGLYCATPGRLPDGAASTARAYAGAAVAVLLALQAQTSSGDSLHPQLDEPVRYRAEVHQATGFVSVRVAVTLADALLLLRARAFATDRPLLDVARDVLAGRLHIQAQESKDE